MVLIIVLINEREIFHEKNFNNLTCEALEKYFENEFLKEYNYGGYLIQSIFYYHSGYKEYLPLKNIGTNIDQFLKMRIFLKKVFFLNLISNKIIEIKNINCIFQFG